jgi:hypothetical protein
MIPDFDFDAYESEQATSEDILQWLNAREELSRLKAKEILLRDKISRTFFRAAKEGTNTHELGNGYKLKYVHKLTRDVDEAMLTNLLPELVKKGVNVEEVVERKPVLKVKAWRDLTPEQHQIFDQCVTTKPATGSLEFVKPKGAE